MTSRKDEGQERGDSPSLDDLKSFITRKQLAESLQISLGTVDRWFHRGIIPFYEFKCEEDSKKGIVRFKIDEVLVALKRFRHEEKKT